MKPKAYEYPTLQAIGIPYQYLIMRLICINILIDTYKILNATTRSIIQTIDYILFYSHT